jgi:hypothetical protein
MEIFLLPIGLLKKNQPKGCSQASLPALFAHTSFKHKMFGSHTFGDRFVGKKDGLRTVLRIRIHRIHVFLGLPGPDLLVRGMDPDPDLDPDPSIIMQK